MLNINLLPVRQLKKRNKARKELIGLLLLFLITITLLAVTGVSQVQKIDSLKSEIADLKKEKAKHAPTLKRIAKLKQDTAEFNRRVEIIDKLKQDSSLTVRVIDTIGNIVDNQRMWFESLEQKNTSLSLTGVALDNQTVAQFMDSLKLSPFVQDVSLTNSSLKVVSGRDLKSFQLVSAVSHPTKTNPENPVTNQ